MTSSKPKEASESSCSNDLIKPIVENGEDLVIENTSEKKRRIMLLKRKKNQMDLQK